jgi:hypothetical protein
MKMIRDIIELRVLIRDQKGIRTFPVEMFCPGRGENGEWRTLYTAKNEYELKDYLKNQKYDSIEWEHVDF